MKILFSKSFRISLLLGLLLNPAQNWCAAAAHPGDLGLQSPSQLLDHSLIEKSSSSGIDATYAVKNLLSSIMEKSPHLTIQEALSRSALLGTISETDVQLHMYGTFTTLPNPKKPGKTIKIFDTDTTTPINKIARSMLDVLDDKVRSTVQPSNPFCGLEGTAIAQAIQALTAEKDGVGNLIKLLKDPAFITAWSKDWDTKANPKNVNGTYVQTDPKKRYSLSEFEKEIKKFIRSLEDLNKEAKTPAEKANSVSDLAKIFMTFLSTKDQKQKATGQSHAVEDYYTTLLNKPFESEYYTTKELEQIGKTLLGRHTTYTIGKDAKGIEDITAYLAHFVVGDISFLQAPFATYTPEDKTKSFPYCAEATIRSLMNSFLYNPKTGRLDITLLPLEIQKSMEQTSLGQKFKDFIEKYPAPTAANYYGNSLKEWLDLVSGLDGVEYKKGEGKNAYEISAGAGPKNLVAVMNAIFGTKADSFETLATLLKVEDKHGTVTRIISFIPEKSGFDLKVTDHGKVIIESKIISETNTAHSAFIISGKKIRNLLENDTFRTKISELSHYTKQDLYGVIFKPSTLNIADYQGTLTPLINAIQYENSLVKSMLTFGADPNFQGTHYQTPLEVAVSSKEDSIAYELLKYGAHVTQTALIQACDFGNFELVKTFIPLLEHRGISPNYMIMLLQASRSQSLPLVEFLLLKGADINGENDLGNTPLLNAIHRDGSSEIVQFLIDKGAHVTEKAVTKAFEVGNSALIKIFLPLLKKDSSPIYYTNLLLKTDFKSLSLVEVLLAKGADINGKDFFGDTLLYNALKHSMKEETPASLIAQYLIEKGAALTSPHNKPSLLSLAIRKGRADITELLIQYGAPLTPEVLLDVISSKNFTTAEKIQLTKSILGKNGIISTDALKAVKAHATDYEEEEEKEEDRLEREQWAELLPLLEQAYREQSSELDLTTQEQKSIPEYVTEVV